MKVVKTVRELRLELAERVVLVPTMGAFHAGHIELMRRAKSEGGQVVVSLFVNPRQFSMNEDYASYPRDFERDAELASAAGVDLLFAPDVDEMYRRSITSIWMEGLFERYEGKVRPTHFSGVATVVLKLFHLTRADVAVFGQKDLQQCAVVRRLVDDLDLSVQLVFAPIVREPDGLAMSSRNAYLSDELRASAPQLHQTLLQARDSLRPARNSREIRKDLRNAHRRLTESGFEVDYLDAIDPLTFEQERSSLATAFLIAAARLGGTRLLDNLAIHTNPMGE